MTDPTSYTTQKKPSLYKRGRTIARVAAVQILFQCEQAGQPASTVLSEFMQHRHVPNACFEDGHIPDADPVLMESIVHMAIERKEAIDEVLVTLLPENWPIERIDPVLRALLRAAIGEMATDTPTQVIINEYLDVAHGFFSGEEPKMVNGILDRFARLGRKLD